MYSALPTRLKAGIRLSLVGAWMLVFASGIASALPGGSGPASALGSIVSAASGAVVALASAASAVGVIADRYRIEWVAAWCAAAGVTPYLVASWMEVATGALDADQALYSSALLAFLILRAQFCAAHAAKLRAMHVDTGGVPLVR